jgi:hypothetical protein
MPPLSGESRPSPNSQERSRHSTRLPRDNLGVLEGEMAESVHARSTFQALGNKGLLGGLEMNFNEKTSFLLYSFYQGEQDQHSKSDSGMGFGTCEKQDWELGLQPDQRDSNFRSNSI